MNVEMHNSPIWKSLLILLLFLRDILPKFPSVFVFGTPPTLYSGISSAKALGSTKGDSRDQTVLCCLSGPKFVFSVTDADLNTQ